ERILAGINGQTGNPRSFDRLSRLIGEQNYRLADWHVASDEINYRRFFYINDLAAIRVEQFDVFSIVHDLVLRLVRDGLVTGLRIDHVDGLHDPERYLQTLHSALAHWLSVEATDDQHSDTVTQPAAPWIVVEKILAPDEPLRQNWPANGTTGYDFLSDVNALLIDPDGRHEIEAVYRQFASITERYDDIVYQAKRFILDDQMLSELHSLARRLHRLAKASRHTADFTLWTLQEALREVIACFPVYRTYIQSETHESDREWLHHAVNDAKRRNKAMGQSVFEFVTQTLFGELPRPLGTRLEAERQTVVARFQQLSATVMAKGMEDTTFYRYYPLTSLNDVGSEPDLPALGIEAFHHHNHVRLAECPHALLTTATHDTKRSEDIRARVNVLSEIPAQWSHALTRWTEMNERHKATTDGQIAPTPNEEYLLYQTLIGVWPGDTRTSPDDVMRDRVMAYMIKAMREAKLTTRWVRPDTEHETAVEQFIRTILSRRTNHAFLDGLSAFVDSIARPALVNSLAQVLLKATSPGVPDFYQGTELLDDSLVDPDNRRPVDFDTRRQMCESLHRAFSESRSSVSEQLLGNWQSGVAKMHVTMSALQLRRDHPALFQQGSYEPLHANGRYVEHMVAFSRLHGNDAALTAVPRLITKLGPSAEFPIGETVWGDGFITMPSTHPRRWHNVLTGEEIELVLSDGTQRLYLRDLFRSFPCALLHAVR
ncbi:MAG: malto-oligosyltrehalose synthase, partial [candidate division Zixibacteria bacterium]|nr:malto-oligosyltrehalose synthase [candidate division Zixibacteria bacterium]